MDINNPLQNQNNVEKFEEDLNLHRNRIQNESREEFAEDLNFNRKLIQNENHREEYAEDLSFNRNLNKKNENDC